MRSVKPWMIPVAAAVLALVGRMGAQPYAVDLGHALAGRGFGGTISVASFDPTLPHLTHGTFHADVTGQDRYGLALTGSGVVTVDASGNISAHGTATQTSPTQGGLILATLWDTQNRQADTDIQRFDCAPGAV